MATITTEEFQANREMDQIVSSMGELPSSPAVVNQVMSMTSDFNADVQSLSKALSADQSIAAKVLKLSNSSFYGRASSVSTLDEAIMILGFFSLRSLVVATATHAMFDSKNSESAESKLWEHSLATAMCARSLAKRIKHPYSEEAFIAGLMHDLGKLIFLQKMPGEYQATLNPASGFGEASLRHEREQFGFDHAQLGRVLMTKWSFPARLTDAVQYHHQPRLNSSSPSEATLDCIIHLADSMTRNMGVAFNEAPVEDLGALESARCLGLDAVALDEMCLELKDSFANEKSNFNA
jgi:putative nucleotidyltransferase with HDIG domain